MPAKKPKKLTGKALLKALKPIKALILDMDGVLTDTKIFYTEGAGWGANYSVVDGFGLKLLMRKGLHICFISAATFTSHKKRAELLGVTHAYFGNEDKIGSFEKICRDLNISPAECAYMGDELFDIPVLERVGVSFAPPASTKKVLAVVNYVTRKKGGEGAVREVCDLLLEAQGHA